MTNWKDDPRRSGHPRDFDKPPAESDEPGTIETVRFGFSLLQWLLKIKKWFAGLFKGVKK